MWFVLEPSKLERKRLNFSCIERTLPFKPSFFPDSITDACAVTLNGNLDKYGKMLFKLFQAFSAKFTLRIPLNIIFNILVFINFMKHLAGMSQFFFTTRHIHVRKIFSGIAHSLSNGAQIQFKFIQKCLGVADTTNCRHFVCFFRYNMEQKKNMCHRRAK